MARPLAAVLAVLFALPALAQTARRAPAAAKAELARDFGQGKDVSAQDFAGQPDALVKLFEQAKYVQAGVEPGDEKETYVAFVRSVARRLGVNPDLAAELYGKRPPRGRRETVAPKNEIDARAALADDVRHNPGISAAKKARMEKDMSRTSEYLKMGLNGDLTQVGGPGERPIEVAFVSPASDGVVYDNHGVARDWSSLPPRVQPMSLTTAAPPPLGAATAGAMSWASLASYFDWEKGKQVAEEAYTGTLNYAKSMGRMCYRFVKQALIDAGVIDAPNPQSVGLVGLRPGAAAMFNQDVKKNPKILDELGYRQVDLARASDDPASVPDGSMLVYAAGCAFADASYGHAEITVGEATYEGLRTRNKQLRRLTVAANDVRVCHFSCTTRSMPFLRTYGKKGCLKMYVPVKSS